MEKPQQTIYLALGTNLGDREGNLSRAASLLGEKIEILERSAVYETPPWGVVDQPDFFNQVVKGETLLAPHQLLDFVKHIEKQLGRVPTYRFGPRVIDIDILLYGRRIINSHRLQIPHPRMLERAFVLVPLAEIEPLLIIPGSNEPVISLLQLFDVSTISKVSGAHSGRED